MNKIVYSLLLLVMCVSCAGSYQIEGTSAVPAMDGSKLYLKVIKNGEMKNVDSCEVLHGNFRFSGVLDTIRMASIYMDDESLLPLVLESGDVKINIDNASSSVNGTPLNDKLYKFIDKHNQLIGQMNELSHKQSQMLLNGMDENMINQSLNDEAAKIALEEDKLVTTFIVDNFDNVLGPGVFMMITTHMHAPVLTPQIEDIMSKATDKFKNDPYVKEFYQTASDNMARMQGLDPSDTTNVGR